ncbi:MAG: transporter substrate-binding domain-containing protein [Bacteroidales bacterium]|nr:transporter substrate-binding domain-containing protein [Bacteroidales bacterium]
MRTIKRVCLMAGIAIMLVFFSCTDQDKPAEIKEHKTKLSDKEKLVVVTDYNSTNYFIYHGRPMGFNYDLLLELANHLGKQLEVKVSNDLKDGFEQLEKGEVDLIAVNLAITGERKQKIAFTTPLLQTRQVLVQKKPDNWRRLTERALDETLIRNQLDLAGKTVYVQKESSHSARLRNLSEEIGDSINIIETDEVVEQLIELVAKGEIEYAISDENIAEVNQTYYPDIDIKTAVSFPQNLAWAVDKSSAELLEAINNWLTGFKKTTRYAVLYNKYFKNHKTAEMVESDYFVLNSGQVSDYDDIIKKYSTKINWDWRLLASMIYQESRFNPNVQSWAGAFGLMQLMPTTASRFGINYDSSVEDQVRAGVDFIGWLENQLSEIKDEQERVKFVLAAYNIGLGHVMDARKLAIKYGKDPKKWDNNVDEFLLKKSDPQYYNDSVVKYGYCRGSETYKYVNDILGRYNHYKNIIAEDYKN